MSKTKILIDTDIADEIDDAWALSLCMLEDCEIVGVTTVFGNTRERAGCAKMLMKKYGGKYSDVPVYVGYGKPLSESIKEEEHILQYTPELDADEYAPDSIEPDKAVDFIIEQAAKYGRELKIICLGALTNLAYACRKNPEAINGVGEVIIMGGAFYKQYADWNVMCDVEAAKMVFESLDNLVAIGADVTHELDIGQEGLLALMSYSGDNLALELCREQLRLWREKVRDRTPCLHDPLAVYYAMDNSVCETEKISVAVITEGYAKGMTLNTDAYNKAWTNSAYRDRPITKKTLVAKSVKREKIINYFLKMFA